MVHSHLAQFGDVPGRMRVRKVPAGLRGCRKTHEREKQKEDRRMIENSSHLSTVRAEGSWFKLTAIAACRLSYQGSWRTRAAQRARTNVRPRNAKRSSAESRPTLHSFVCTAL